MVVPDLHSTMYLLNPAKNDYSVFISSFTFHYVSIKSGVSIYENDSYNTFTFHYVSIKSLIAIEFMFWIMIYIPLCIY